MEPQTPIAEPDGRPSASEALTAVLDEINDDAFLATSIVIRILASGEVPYRVYRQDGGEYEGGVAYVPPGT
jgi:hypothetical protein